MRRLIALLTGSAAALGVAQAPAGAAPPETEHVSIVDGPFDFCGVQVTYREETDLRLVSRPSGPDGDWKFTGFDSGWFRFTSVETGRAITVTYHKADRDKQIVFSDGNVRTIRVMNNRTEVWTDDAGNRLGATHGPISFTVTVSYAGTPRDPRDDFWTVDPETYTVHGNWKMDDHFCDVMLPALT